MHLLPRVLLEVEVHLEVGLRVDAGGGVHLLEPPELALHGALGHQEGVVVLAAVDAEVNEGEGVVGLEIN